MKDLYVLAAYNSLLEVAKYKGQDRAEIAKAIIALGTYAQKNCGERTWGIRLEGVMLLYKPKEKHDQS